MSKSILYTANTTAGVVPIGSSIPIGSVVRRYGNCINVNGSTINLTEAGYYDIDVVATFNASAVGDVKIAVQQNGTTVQGATATETIGTASTEYRAISIDTTVRVYCCQDSNISIVVDSDSTTSPTLNNFAVTVMKV